MPDDDGRDLSPIFPVIDVDDDEDEEDLLPPGWRGGLGLRGLADVAKHPIETAPSRPPPPRNPGPKRK